MIALHYPSYGKLEIVEQVRPTPAPDEVLVAVAACGLCGSELETFRTASARRKPPLIMGHEFCGVVAEVGSQVQGSVPGRRVVVNAIVPCGSCVRCSHGETHLCASREIFGMHRQGAFAEFVAAPERALLDWPDDLLAPVACLAEPLGNGVHVVRLTHGAPSGRVVVVGAGPIGLAVLQCFRVLREARVLVSDIRDERLDIATTLGAERTVNASSHDLEEEVMRWTDGEGADIIVDAVGSESTKRSSVACARPGGACVWIGLHQDDVTISSYDLTLAERRLLGTYGATMADMSDAVELMRAGRVDMSTWVTRFELGQGVEAFRRMLEPGPSDVKAVIEP